MVHYDRIDVCKGIDVNETNESKECDIFHYWYFLDKGFKFQQDVYNGCLEDVKINNISVCNKISSSEKN